MIIQVRRPGQVACGSIVGGVIAAIAWEMFVRFPVTGSLGLGWSLLALTALAVLLILGWWSGRLKSSWASWLAVPVTALAISIAVYSNRVVDYLGLLAILLLLATLGSWIATGSVSFRNVGSIFLMRAPWDALRACAGIAWIGCVLSQASTGPEAAKRRRDIVIGLLIAVPFLICFSVLFAAADPIVASFFERLFGPDLVDWIGRIIRRVLLAGFVAGYLAAILSPAPSAPRARTPPPYRDVQASATAFFLPLAVLFAAFLAVQAAALFGGEAFLRARDLTYASYARQGFGALLVAAALAGAAVLAWYSACIGTARFLRGAVLVFLGETALVAASAFWRLSLYVDTYGLTLARAYGVLAILTIALGLGLLILGVIRHHGMECVLRAVTTLAVVSFTIAMTLPVERIVAEWNVSQYLAGRRAQFDTSYHRHLSADAWPAYLRLPMDQSEPIYREIHYPLLAGICGTSDEYYGDPQGPSGVNPPTYWNQGERWQSYNLLRARWCARLPELQEQLRERSGWR